MATPGFIVEGLGNTESLQSASHGAGRKITRSRAKSKITNSEMKKQLKGKGISLIGGATEEAPVVYKNIQDVIDFQSGLVKVHGSFMPKIVRMDKK